MTEYKRKKPELHDIPDEKLWKEENHLACVLEGLSYLFEETACPYLRHVIEQSVHHVRQAWDKSK